MACGGPIGLALLALELPRLLVVHIGAAHHGRSVPVGMVAHHARFARSCCASARSCAPVHRV
jgi:hypothetical protein